MIKQYTSTQLEPAVIVTAFELRAGMTTEEILANMRDMWSKLQESDITFSLDYKGNVLSVTYPHGYLFETTGCENFIIKDEVKQFRSLPSCTFLSYYKAV